MPWEAPLLARCSCQSVSLIVRQWTSKGLSNPVFSWGSITRRGRRIIKSVQVSASCVMYDILATRRLNCYFLSLLGARRRDSLKLFFCVWEQRKEDCGFLLRLFVVGWITGFQVDIRNRLLMIDCVSLYTKAKNTHISVVWYLTYPYPGQDTDIGHRQKLQEKDFFCSEI